MSAVASLALEGWRAWLSDGRTFTDADPDLQVEQHSPWRELEWLARVGGLTIDAAEVFCGLRYVRFEASGCRLTCGGAMHERLGLNGGVSGMTSYRWVRREEKHRWLWGICSAQGVWQVEAPVGVEMCPDPLSFARPLALSSG